MIRPSDFSGLYVYKKEILHFFYTLLAIDGIHYTHNLDNEDTH